MQEVIERRLSHLEDESGGYSKRPDLILLDGGMTHVSSVKEVLNKLKIDIPVFGMVKDDKHRTRALLSPDGEIGINPTSSFFHLITRIQDEVHRTAIGYHRTLHQKISSELDGISGIGKARRNALLTHFKSLENIKNATLSELESVEGMNKKAAESVYNYFKKN